jgi:hypothetical protein
MKILLSIIIAVIAVITLYNKKVSFFYWLIPAILCPILLAYGVFSLQQPWGVTYQKFFALGFFFILWLVSLYFLFQNKFKFTDREREKRKWIFTGIGSATFVVGGIFMSIIEPSRWKIDISAVVFFGLGLAVSIRAYKKI